MSQILNSSVIVKTKKSPQAAMLTRYHSSFEHELVGGKCPNSFFKYRIDAYNTPLLIKPPVLQNSNNPPLKKFTSYNSPPS